MHKAPLSAQDSSQVKPPVKSLRAKSATRQPASTPPAYDAILEVVEIDALAIDDEFRTIAAHIARRNHLYADALKTYLFAKAREKRVRAEVYLKLRAEWEDAGEKITEGRLSAQVDADAAVNAAVEALIEAEFVKTRLGGEVEALRSKRDALVSLGAHIRAEMAGNPAIRGEHRGARDVARNFEPDEDYAVDLDSE